MKKIIDSDEDKLIKLYKNLAYRLIKMWPDHFNWLRHFSVEELRLLTHHCSFEVYHEEDFFDLPSGGVVLQGRLKVMVEGGFEIQSDKEDNQANPDSMQNNAQTGQHGPGMHYDDISKAEAPYLVLPNVDVEYQVIGQEKLVVMHLPDVLVPHWFKENATSLREEIEKLISPEQILKKEVPSAAKIEEGDKVKLRDLRERRSTLAPSVMMGHL